MLDDARKATRRASREAERASRAPAEERYKEREARRLAKVRDARDRAQAQATTAAQEAVALRAQLAETVDELHSAIIRADAAEARLSAIRVDATDPVKAAATLAAAFTSPNSDFPNDSRGIGPGEPARIDPGRTALLPRIDLDRVTAAAKSAGLSNELTASVATWLPTLLNAYVVPPRRPATVRDHDLRVEVLGGGTQIGGSCVLVTAGNTRLLVDAGTRPGALTPSQLAPPAIDRAYDGRLDGIVITHAHNDHAGWVPSVLIRRPDTPVFATDATAALLPIMWFDSAKVLARRNRETDGTGLAAPYGREDVQHALTRLRVLPFGQRARVGDVDLELFPAGHIVGAASVIVHAGERRVVISGDVSRHAQRTVSGIKVPASAGGADLLLLESTYAGSHNSTSRTKEVARLVGDIAAVTSAGGRVLIPAFALGRAQEVALTIATALPEVEVLIDGLARSVTSIYEQQLGPDRAPMRIFGERVRAVPPGGTRDALADLRSGVVIATSGMLTAGPAVTWARKLLPDASAALMVVGYQDADSPGGRLLALAKHGGGEFELPTLEGEFVRVPVEAQVAQYGLGAHATANELVTIAAEIGAREVMLVHGEPQGQAMLAERLESRGQATTKTGEWSPHSRSTTRA
ncbi:MBL fold metallo-hydrolase [Lentzea albidocapillata]|uniref:MBL fold metallo-hydrolase n=1 Tax=Lentzea albidocapillata TaxID=40571 RepID=UPI0013566919|nr:MBL fold metallo-hydrolase [Lentzea albidocapillata]